MLNRVWLAGSLASSSIGGARRFVAASNSSFDQRADGLLQKLELALDHPKLETEELSCAMGVLTLNLGSKGTWVINKQSPNSQIWWSSPLSGPKRFAFNEARSAWISTRDDRTSLLDLLSEEIKQAAGVQLVF